METLRVRQTETDRRRQTAVETDRWRQTGGRQRQTVSK